MSEIRYRGYLILDDPTNPEVEIWVHDVDGYDHIDDAATVQDAKNLIDSWQEAR